MATLTIDGIPDAILDRLARRAARHGRCLNSEAILSLINHLEHDTTSGKVSGSATGCPPTGERHHGRPAPWGEP